MIPLKQADTFTYGVCLFVILPFINQRPRFNPPLLEITYILAEKFAVIFFMGILAPIEIRIYYLITVFIGQVFFKLPSEFHKSIGLIFLCLYRLL